MIEYTGWLLDIYEDEGRGLKLWFICEDGRRMCLFQHFPVGFYAGGATARLRSLWRWLKMLPNPPELALEERRDLFIPDPLPVLAVRVEKPSDLRDLFQKVERAFPDLTFYDADVQVQLRHAAVYNTFPLAFCRLVVDDQRYIREIEVKDSRWEIDPAPVPLRVMEVSLDCDPNHRAPANMTVRFCSDCYRLSFLQGENTAYWFKAALERHDPDVLVTDFGDTWLLDYLIKSVNGCYEKMPLSRDPEHPIAHVGAKSYFSYGQIIFRGQQTHLFGRLHIDRRNAMMWSDYALEGILENARVTALPVQTAARVSPGTGISSMQMITAMQSGVLVPWHKQQVEQPKSMLDLVHADFGGLVYQPMLGLHRDVAEIDFVSMYPAVMARCDISPEKTPISLSDPPSENPGLVPRTLMPLLEKRRMLKTIIARMPAWDPRRAIYKERASAAKWLLVVCFGYLGYRNARFGRIEAHEAVTAGGREALLRAKEAAEDLGFLVLHMFVDCLWVYKDRLNRSEDFQPLLDEIHDRTGLYIALDGIYRWVVFLPSRVDRRVPVGNRYFGVFQNGEIKVRGLEARRRDAPPWVAAAQMDLIKYLAQAPDAGKLCDYLPGALELLRQAYRQLKSDEVPLEDLLVAQRLSRDLEKYSTPSPAARAALQLRSIGKDVRPGQRVRFLLTCGKPGVWAWDRPEPVDRRMINRAAYRRLLLRAAENVFQPFGFTAGDLKYALEGNVNLLSLIHAPEFRKMSFVSVLPTEGGPDPAGL